MKEFTTAVGQAPPPAFESDPITFVVDGEEWTASPPTGGQLALAMAAQSEHADPRERVAGLINFLDSILDDKAQTIYRERLLDAKDPFDLPDIEGIVGWLTEEWTGRRPTSPVASRPQRRRTGLRSTAMQPSVAATS